MAPDHARNKKAADPDASGQADRTQGATIDAAIDRAASIARLLAPEAVRIEAFASGIPASLPCDALALDNALLSMVISALRAGHGPGVIRLGAMVDVSFDPFSYARVFVEDDADAICTAVDSGSRRRMSGEDERIFDLLVAAQFSVETGGTLTCAGQGTATRRTTLSFPVGSSTAPGVHGGGQPLAR